MEIPGRRLFLTPPRPGMADPLGVGRAPERLRQLGRVQLLQPGGPLPRLSPAQMPERPRFHSCNGEMGVPGLAHSLHMAIDRGTQVPSASCGSISPRGFVFVYIQRAEGQGESMEEAEAAP